MYINIHYLKKKKILYINVFFIKSVYLLEKLKKNEKKYKKVHKILTCKTSEKLMKYINRDKTQ